MITYSISDIRAEAKENGLVLRKSNVLFNGTATYAVFNRATNEKMSDDRNLSWWSWLLEEHTMSVFVK